MREVGAKTLTAVVFRVLKKRLKVLEDFRLGRVVLRRTILLVLDKFKTAQDYFKPAKGGVLVDVSCGSGLFSRKFAKSGAYSKVIALDFSENMLRQCYDFIEDDKSILSSNLSLVRADISRLPFPFGSIDAVHAGATLHCWPSHSNAVAEINRVLRSGGVLELGSTFLRVCSSTPPFLRPFRQRALRNYLFDGRGDRGFVHLLWTC